MSVVGLPGGLEGEEVAELPKVECNELTEGGSGNVTGTNFFPLAVVIITGADTLEDPTIPANETIFFLGFSVAVVLNEVSVGAATKGGTVIGSVTSAGTNGGGASSTTTSSGAEMVSITV